MITQNKSQSNDVENFPVTPHRITFANPQAIDYLFFLHRSKLINWRAFGLGVALSSFADRYSGRANPSRQLLANVTGINKRDISRVVSELEKARFYTVTRYLGRLNTYTLTLGKEAARGKKPETGGRRAAKPVGKQPPISIENNDIKQESGNKAGLLVAKEELSRVAWSDSCFLVHERVSASLAAAFPLVDIEVEITKAHAWCCLNPDKAPTRDYGRFLFRWMTKVVPGGAGGATAACGYTPPSLDLIAAIGLEYDQEGNGGSHE